ncbi:PAS domain-containing sensor histidine kinase [Coleofasciculus sp.]|uniref:PAS domain-containing sensor histidine kinase n=1 Tax=Coleofasciculus sp. TaxID=3100458 RepID=UPI003A1946C6
MAAAHQATEDERLRYQELFEFAPDGYLITTASGVVQDANQAAATLLNIDKKRLIGKPLAVFVTDANRPTFHTQLNRLTNLSCPEFPSTLLYRDWELSLQPRQSEPFPADISISAIINPQSQIVGLRWLIRDMSYRHQVENLRRELEAEKEFSELKSRFIQTVSHEFRTPLNMIYVSAQLLARSHDSLSEDKCNQLLNRTDKAVRRITKILDDVLIFSKASADKLELNPTLLDIEQFCQTIVEDYQVIAGSSKTIQFNSQGTNHSVCLDEKLLYQILGNLLSNAINYSQPNSTINLTLTHPYHNVCFQIQDQGIGIPREDIPRLFDPFHRARNVSNVPGTGLGLSIVKKAIEIHGGTINVHSEIGIGTTFTVTLPLGS